MAAQKFNFTKSDCGSNVCEQGATFSVQLIWEKEEPADSEIFLPVDLSAHTAKMQVRKDVGGDLIVELSTSNSRIVLGGVDGTISLLIPATVTTALPAGNYKYDLEITNDQGFVTRFIEGRFDIIGQVTV